MTDREALRALVYAASRGVMEPISDEEYRLRVNVALAAAREVLARGEGERRDIPAKFVAWALTDASGANILTDGSGYLIVEEDQETAQTRVQRDQRIRPLRWADE